MVKFPVTTRSDPKRMDDRFATLDELNALRDRYKFLDRRAASGYGLGGSGKFCGLLLTDIAVGIGTSGPGHTGNGKENASSCEAQEVILHD